MYAAAWMLGTAYWALDRFGWTFSSHVRRVSQCPDWRTDVRQLWCLLDVSGSYLRHKSYFSAANPITSEKMPALPTGSEAAKQQVGFVLAS